MHTAFTSSGIISTKEWKSGKGTHDNNKVSHTLLLTVWLLLD